MNRNKQPLNNKVLVAVINGTSDIYTVFSNGKLEQTSHSLYEILKGFQTSVKNDSVI